MLHAGHSLLKWVSIMDQSYIYILIFCILDRLTWHKPNIYLLYRYIPSQELAKFTISGISQIHDDVSAHKRAETSNR